MKVVIYRNEEIMKKGLKITLIVLGVLVSIVVLDTLQAKVFNNSPLLKIRDNLDGGTIDYIDKGIFVNHYHCNNEKVTIWKGTKFSCPIEESKNTNLIGDTPLTNKTDLIFTINTGNKSCVPIKLAVYEDGTYELFTTYESCRPGENCTMKLTYTKSIKGTYSYNVMKIFEDKNIVADQSHSMYNLPEYEIYMSDKYVQKDYGYYYTIEKNTTNSYLEDFLKQIEVNLNLCANPEYID